MRLLIGWAINALALMALPYLMSSVQIKSWGTAFLVALVIGLLNTIVRPILFILTLPVNVLTLGLFTFVLNGFMFWVASRLVDGFFVGGFWWAVLAAIVYSIISSAISSLVMKDDVRR